MPLRRIPALAALRASTTAHLVASAIMAGGISSLAAVTPARSTGGAPGSPVVTADCPAGGTLADGTPCIAGPAAGDQGGGQPQQGGQQTSTTPAPPPPDGAPSPPPAPASTTPAPAAALPVPAPAGRPGQTTGGPHSQTRLGPRRVESQDPRPVPRPHPRDRRGPAQPQSTPGGTASPSTGNAAGLPGLSPFPPGPALPVPDVLIDRFPIPPFLLPIYQAAGVQYDVPWQVLAAINEIETNYGRNLNVSSAGAMGWMQFIPSSWRTYGVDANGDGRKDPYNPVDAIFAAARYLRAAGADKDLRQAIYAYNHAQWYVDSVMLRARLVRALPADLVGALTALTQGHFPLAAPARYGHDGVGARVRSRPGTAVVAINDGVVRRIGVDRRGRRYVVLEDVYGNTYTYGRLGSLATSYPAPRPSAVLPGTQEHDPATRTRHGRDPRPTAPASAGRQTRSPSPASTAPPNVVRVAKQRLFAHPMRPDSFRAGGDQQVSAAGMALPAGASLRDYTTVDLGLRPSDVVLRPLRPGAQVSGGTILGRVGRDGAIRLGVRPSGAHAPSIDPRPFLSGWRLLDAAQGRAGRRREAMDLRRPSIGQILLMSKEQLARLVLADRRIHIYPCGRTDIQAGRIDRRVLAVLALLPRWGLSPTITSLECGHSYLTAAGGVSEHSSGNAVDIAAINGTPILGHQGPGSITETTIRRLLTLQGSMKPHQIISLMRFPGTDNTLVLSDHANHIHVGFYPQGGAGRPSLAAVLRPAQWSRLVHRLNQIDNPTVAGQSAPAPAPVRHPAVPRLVLPRTAPALIPLPPL